jgi:transcription elongation factor GreA
MENDVDGRLLIMQHELTENDIKKMEEEIEYRTLVVRKEALEDVKEARAHGDLSENFEYHAAKKVKNQNESRIRYLQKMIKTAVVIKDNSAPDEAGVNNTVKILYEDDQTTETIKLVSTVRSDSLEGLISIESPLGKAILGHKEGDRVLVEVNQNVSYYIQIHSIVKTDDSNDKIQSY